MSCFDILDHLVKSGNGFLRTAQVLENGISKPTLAEYVKKKHMERIAQGIYLSEDAWPDSLFLLQLSNSRIVFSHETALQLHGLTEREPKTVSVTVKAGYNATHLRKKGICVYQVKPDIAELGVTSTGTCFGNSVRTYDAERTICDIIRNKASMDIQVFQYAIKEYMSGNQKNISRLMAYAKKLRIESALRTYTEIML
ncbi:AbiEi antitoxin N-terminal domain-containing protein [bacterium]|nr:AbiEi antitoxin N-terminal domain-containing protein [bacterium]